VITVTRPITGVIFDRKGENYVLYPCYVCLAVGLFLLSITHTSPILLLAGVFVGLGYGTFMSNGQAVCIKLTPSHRVSVALSTYFVALDFGLGVGPYILGSLHSTLTFQNLYVVAACTAVICLILYYLLYGRRVGGQARMAAQEDTLIDYE
jgi:MFS family permease